MSLIIVLFLSIVTNGQNPTRYKNHQAALIQGTEVEEGGWLGERWLPRIEFWTDVFLYWENLYTKGWYDERLHVLYGDGIEDYKTNWPRYRSEQYLGFGSNITDFPATLDGVNNIYTWLKDGNPPQNIKKMTYQDLMFNWSFSGIKYFSSLSVIDISDPMSPSVVGTCSDLFGFANEIAVHNDYAFVASGTGGIYIVFIGDPSNPQIVSRVSLPGKAMDVEVYDFSAQGIYAYVSSWKQGLFTIDVTNPYNPTVTDQHILPGERFAYGVGISEDGKYVFVTGQEPLPLLKGFLAIFDASPPSSPVFQSIYINQEINRQSEDVDIASRPGNEMCAFLCNDAAQGNIFNVSDPVNPQFVTKIPDVATSTTLEERDNLLSIPAFSTDGVYSYTRLFDFDVQDPSNPTLLGFSQWYQIGVSSLPNDMDIGEVNGTLIASIAINEDGLFIYDVTEPQNPVKLSWLYGKRIWGVEHKIHPSGIPYLYTVGPAPPPGAHSYLNLTDGEIIDYEYASLVNPIAYKNRFFWFAQSLSGGFIDDLSTQENSVLLTSTLANQYAHRCDNWSDIYTQTWLEFERFEGEHYYHSEFNYHTQNALRQESPDPNQQPRIQGNPDYNHDEKISMSEAAQYVIDVNSISLEEPQFSDNSGISPYVYHDIPPYPPENLRGRYFLWTPNIPFVRLWWNPNKEYDLAGYNVYRANIDQTTISPGPGGIQVLPERSTFYRINDELVPKGTENFIDMNVIFGKTYAYRIEAIDEIGNWSDPSNIIYIYCGPPSDLNPLTASNGRKLTFSDEGLGLAFSFIDTVYYISTTDGGNTWGNLEKVGNGFYPATSTGGSGNINSIFMGYDFPTQSSPGALHLFYSNKEPEGVWIAPSSIFSYTEDGKFTDIVPPAIVCNNDTVHTVFELVTKEEQDTLIIWNWNLYYGCFSEDNPVVETWELLDSLKRYIAPPETAEVETLPSLSPSIVYSPSGVEILWEKSGGIYHKEKSSGMWGETEFIAYGVDPFIDYYNGIDIVWADNRLGPLPGKQYKTWIYHRHRFMQGDWQNIEEVYYSDSAYSRYPVIGAGTEVCWERQKWGIEQPSDIYNLSYDTENFDWSNTQNLTDSPSESRYPQMMIGWEDGNRILYTAWCDAYDDSLYKINVTKKFLGTAPVVYANLGGEEPSSFTVERDGYISYGDEYYKTVDYDSTELIYNIQGLDGEPGQYCKLMFYHEFNAATKLRVRIDNKWTRNVWVASGEPISVEGMIPVSCLKDGEINVTVETVPPTQNALAVCSALWIYDETEGGGPMLAGESNKPLTYYLRTPSPSPFNDNTTISYSFAKPGKVSLKVYDQTGRLVRTLENGIKDAGHYSVRWNGCDNNNRKVGAGVYFTRLIAENFKTAKKVILVR